MAAKEVPNPDIAPIESIEIPKTTTKSARIRWLRAMGYTVAEISNFLGIRYQMVRNIATSTPKRMAREDLPPLEVVFKPEVDDVQIIMDTELEASLKAERKRRKADDSSGGEDE